MCKFTPRRVSVENLGGFMQQPKKMKQKKGTKNMRKMYLKIKKTKTASRRRLGGVLEQKTASWCKFLRLGVVMRYKYQFERSAMSID